MRHMFWAHLVVAVALSCSKANRASGADDVAPGTDSQDVASQPDGSDVAADGSDATADGQADSVDG